MTHQKSKFYLLSGISFILILLLFSCTATNQVRTVGKGNMGMEITLGGPMFTDLDAPIPMPNLFAGARYGLRDDLDIAAHFNITSIIIPGIMDLITGVYWIPIQPGIGNQANTQQRGWGAGGSFTLQWVTNFKHGLRIFPAIELAGGWRTTWFNPFIGASVGLDFHRTNDKKPITQVNPFLGSEFILNNRVSLALKCTIYDCAYNYYGSQTHWVYIVNKPEEKKKYGLFGIALGFSYNFGYSKKRSGKK